MQILFLLFAALAVVAAFNVILQRNPLYSAIGLIGTLISVAALFLTLAAPFIAAVQIIVYAGAIVVLFVFVIMLLNVRAEESRADEQKYLRWLAPPLFLALLAEVFLAVRYVGDAPPPLPAVSAADAPRQWLGSVETIGTDMFTIVGAMLLAKRDPQFGRRRAPAEPAAAAGRAEEVGAGARR
jgi:NADH-quinone oxidoreductase subunit J